MKALPSRGTSQIPGLVSAFFAMNACCARENVEAINELLSRVDNLPPAPQILPLLMQSLQGVDTHLDRVVDLIAFDPGLTAKLLQTCNSAYFGRSTPVEDVYQAVQRLGFLTVYRIVAIVSGTSCLRPSKPIDLDCEQLWKHSITTAFAAQYIGEDAGLEAGSLFTAGLLHDLGKVVLALAKQGPFRSVEDMDHAEVGGRLLERWKFSPAMAASVRYHHEPLLAGAEAKHAACICLANDLSHCLENNSTEALSESDSKILGLAIEDVARYKERLKENVQFVEAMCQV